MRWRRRASGRALRCAAHAAKAVVIGDAFTALMQYAIQLLESRRNRDGSTPGPGSL